MTIGRPGDPGATRFGSRKTPQQALAHHRRRIAETRAAANGRAASSYWRRISTGQLARVFAALRAGTGRLCKTFAGRWRNAARLGLSCTFVLLAASSCTLSYLPPVPESQLPPVRMELTSERGVEVVDELLHLTVHIDNVSRGGWVALQWFDPRNRERASDSLWIEPNHSALRHTFVLSEHVEVTPGRWRAVVSFEGEILRQFSVDIP